MKDKKPNPLFSSFFFILKLFYYAICYLFFQCDEFQFEFVGTLCNESFSRPSFLIFLFFHIWCAIRVSRLTHINTATNTQYFHWHFVARFHLCCDSRHNESKARKSKGLVGKSLRVCACFFLFNIFSSFFYFIFELNSIVWKWWESSPRYCEYKRAMTTKRHACIRWMAYTNPAAILATHAILRPQKHVI